MARDLGLLMGSCLRGARCAPTKTQSRVEISPVGAILTRQPPEPVRHGAGTVGGGTAEPALAAVAASMHAL